MELTALESSDGGRIDLRRLSQVTRSSSEGDVHWLEDEGLTKKKKKKKKKRRSVTCGSNDSDGGTREVFESRFEEALDCARKGSASRINVSDCHLHDASIRRLMEALKANQVLTHLDISRNDITDDGAQAIAATLGGKLSLPELSLLDVRQTRLSPDGCAILAGVMRVRKELRVEMDLEEEQLQPEKEAAAAAQVASAPEAAAAEEEAGSEVGVGQEVELSLGRELKTEDPEMLARESWQQVEGALKLSPDCAQALPAVSAALRRVVVGLEEEISGLKLPLQLQHLSELMPHLRSAMQHLPLLLMVLDMVPPSRATSYDPTPQPAVGSHRLQASTIVTFLVQIGTDITDKLLVESGLVPRLVHICLTHPNNSSLQCSVLRMLMAGFESPVEQLWSCLLLPNLGLQPGAAACCEKEIQPLHRLLAAHCLEAQSRAFGRRSPLSGFAITLAQEMRSLCHETDEQHGNDTLKSMLEADLQWQELVEEGGPLDILTSQQQGCLGGVRPKVSADEAVEDDMAQLVTAMGMSRREIVSMLQGSGPALSPEFEP